MPDSFFLLGAIPPNAEAGTYNFLRVVLSYAVATFASYTALLLAHELVAARSAIERRLLHWGGALAMGTGIWSMHFVGMLSYKMTMALEYDPWLTSLSLLIAVGAAYGALLIVARERLSARQLAAGGILLGLAICGMHYTGMAAMKMDAALRYLPGLFFLSIVIAISASCAALWIAFTLARRRSPDHTAFKLGAALIMGGAICGMHYTGMEAAVFIPFADCRRDPNQSFDTLAAVTIGTTALVLFLAHAVVAYRAARTEFQLRDSESKVRFIIDNALDGLITIDETGIVEAFNPAAERIFGYRAEEMIGKKMAEMIIPPSEREAHDAGMSRFLKEEVGVILGKRIELPAQDREGRIFPVEMAVIARRQQGRYAFTSFLRDITAQKSAEAERDASMRALEANNQELDDFAHIVSHDLKEPLRGIRNHATFLLEDFGDRLEGDGARRLSRMVELSERMQQLIDDLLLSARLGRNDMAMQNTDPNDIISAVAKMMEMLLDERQAQIRVPRPLPMICCDPARITEAFRNLITNGIKYNDKQHPIVEIGFLPSALTVQGPESDVFYVKDNGIGIARQFHHDIFGMFKRLGDPAAGEQSGTGAGLAFVKKIIEHHGGRIWLQSELGEGTTFYFILPKCPPHKGERGHGAGEGSSRAA